MCALALEGACWSIMPRSEPNTDESNTLDDDYTTCELVYGVLSAECNNSYWVQQLLSAAIVTTTTILSTEHSNGHTKCRKVEDQKSITWAEAKIHRMPQPPARKACGVTSLGFDFCACMCIYKISYRKFGKSAKYRKSERFPVQSSVRYIVSLR